MTDGPYVVPGSMTARQTANANCFGVANSVNCQGSSTTTGTVSASHEVSYQVRGATLSLLLPDGRVVVVNCESSTLCGGTTSIAGAAEFRW